MKLKVGDKVVVIAGKNRNKTGEIMRALPKSNRVVVKGVNTVTRHVRKTKERAGQKVTFEAPIHASNVMLLDPKTNKGTRIGHKTDSKGKKTRVTKKSKTTL